MKSSCLAPSNIALLKYWGKRDVEQNLPLNPSLSLTLDEAVSTHTTVEFMEGETDALSLNGAVVSGPILSRVSRFLDILREKAGVDHGAKVVSRNTFPTAAGIASSASGFAALAGAGSRALGLDLSDAELSSLARQGSGSAARSIHGGFVEWGDESAIQLYPSGHWAALRDLIVVISSSPKSIGSTEAMQATVETSRRFQQRLQGGLPDRMAAMKKAIAATDFPQLAPLIMEESADLHACMEDTIPPVRYLTELSRQVMERIDGLNKDRYLAAYTFDAGPNPHVLLEQKDLSSVRGALQDLPVQMVVAGPGKGLLHSRRHLF